MATARNFKALSHGQTQGEILVVEINYLNGSLSQECSWEPRGNQDPTVSWITR
jgi:hypothetical protein